MPDLTLSMRWGKENYLTLYFIGKLHLTLRYEVGKGKLYLTLYCQWGTIPDSTLSRRYGTGNYTWR